MSELEFEPRTTVHPQGISCPLRHIIRLFLAKILLRQCHYPHFVDIFGTSVCVCVCECVCVWERVTQLCPTFCDPMNCSPPGSSVHGILEARILEWVAMPFSRGSSWPTGDPGLTRVSCVAGRFFTVWALREALKWKQKGSITNIKLYPQSGWSSDLNPAGFLFVF